MTTKDKYFEIQGSMEDLEALHKALCKIVANPTNLTGHVKTASFEVVLIRNPTIPQGV